jgi:hypothetical protein
LVAKMKAAHAALQVVLDAAKNTLAEWTAG